MFQKIEIAQLKDNVKKTKSSNFLMQYIVLIYEVKI